MAVPDTNGAIVPDAIRKERNLFLRKQLLAQEEALATPQPNEETTAEQADESPEVAVNSDVDSTLGEADEAGSVNLEPDFMDAKWEVPLRAPLKQIYVKSGEFVLGKLAMVPGLAQVEIAQLADDTQRLEIEAFVRGYQGEVIELIGLRNLLAARVRLLVKQNKLEQAAEELSRLQSLPTYNEMANGLVIIQRQYIDEGDEDLPTYAKIKVERMFANTRELLQKYLQDTLIADTQKLVENASGN